MLLASTANYAAASGMDYKGWIAGVGVGASGVTVDPINQSNLKSYSETPGVLTVFGGYNFTDWFGIEFDLSKTAKFEDENNNQDASVFGTSFTPKLTYRFNDGFNIYLKAGFQYLLYDQEVNTSNDSDTYWSGIDTVYGAGIEWTFESDMRVRLDYKYAKVNLERTENTTLINFYDDEFDLTYNSLSLSTYYQF